LLDTAVKFLVSRGGKRCVEGMDAPTCEILHEQF